MTTKNLIPRASGEGGIGITDVTWGYGYYDTGNFNKGLFVSGHNITQVIAETVTQGGLGGEWERNVLDIYYNGGNVGIGTTNPGAKLDIFGTNSSLKFTRDAGDRSAEMVYDGSKFLIKAPDSDRLSITDHSSNELLTVNPNDGNVGIGITDPLSKTHIEDGHLLISQSTNTTQENILLQSSGYRIGSTFYGNVSIRSNYANSTNSASLNFYTAGSSTGTTERMRIDASGNVGIGTTSPGAQLELYAPTGVVGIRIKSVNTETSYVDFADQDDNNTGSIAYYHPTNAMQFKTNDSEKMRISSGGNVGIGTTDPGAKLEVIRLDQNVTESALKVYRGDTSPDHRPTAPIFNVFNGTSGSTEVFRVQGNGNVGIGTTNPDGKLEVKGGFSYLEGLSLKPASGTVSEINSGSNSYDLSIKNGAWEALRIKANGNVGIGTTNPGGYSPGTVGKFKLDIASSESLFMGCDDASEGTRTTNTNKSFRVGGPSYQYSDGSSIVAINSLFCTSDDVKNRLGIGFGTSGMQAPSEIVFATQAYNTFNQTSNSSGTLTNRRLRIDNNGILVYGLSVSSDVLTNSNGYLTTSSDKRLKNDLGDCEYGLSEVLQVQPKKYTWKDGPEDAAATIGFFAQDVHSIMPEAAPREAVKNENGEDDYKWGFHSQTIIAALVNATKEQQQLIEDLRSEVEALKNK